MTDRDREGEGKGGEGGEGGVFIRGRDINETSPQFKPLMFNHSPQTFVPHEQAFLKVTDFSHMLKNLQISYF